MLQKLHIKLKSFVIYQAFELLSVRDRQKLSVVLLLQTFLGLLDLLGVAIIGLLGSLAVSGVSSRGPGDRVYKVLEIFNIADDSIQFQATTLGLLAAILFIGKTLLSLFLTRQIIFFLSRRGASISSNLLSRLLSQSFQKVQGRSLQESLYSITSGVNSITVGILATGIALLSDVVLLIIMLTGLLAVDTIIALSTLILFGSIGLLLYRLMNIRAKALGVTQTQLSIHSNQRIYEILGAFREALVRNRREYYAREIGSERAKLADSAAEIAFIPTISKYVIELTVVVGSFAVSVLQFYRYDAIHAVALLSVFIAASTRIAPAVLRVQQGAITIKTNIGASTPTFELVRELAQVSELEKVSDELDTEHFGFKATVDVFKVSMRYGPSDYFAVKNATFGVREGESVALVGQSGAGKTTLVDVVLGVLEPTEGSVQISGHDPLNAISIWPGAISYVPQEVLILQGNIRENVAMGFPHDSSSDTLVWESLKIAQLDEFVRQLPSQLDTQVGDRGIRLSGGQRQRLGIARAMYTKPKLLVMDEATSSLDGQTEFDIGNSIRSMHGKVTIILIAHRLSTVRDFDRVIYMDSGEIKAEGSFESVRMAIPEFDTQAKLMGL